ncbi:alpha-L-rhamnosidase [Arenivirga flava]|uniref:alpha-L-rhamnosidase n=1 Tax=Arenivirga flava TaxID=1930060 RepID=A0AA37UHP1_9MICO|nr:alpha-L-rhamnosidase [Arenivirga flava]GMA29108.1 alpha-L-rhamnosidase [Arenivirga flava]
MPRIDSLRAELRTDTPYVATPTPRLSWTVTDAAGWMQAAAELSDGGDPVHLDTRDSHLVAWPFAPLAAGERREVRVRIRSTEGAATDWSEPLAVEAGFLADGAWTAEPIGLADPVRPAQPTLLRTSFAVDRPLRRARLFWTALGVAAPSLNGEPVDDTVLAPGWTSYRQRLVHETVDVTALVREGENVLAAALAGCWYTERYGFFVFAKRVYGEQPRLLAQLELEFEDGTTRTVATGPGWRAHGEGPTVDSGLYAGERFDARRVIDGWDEPGFDDTEWADAAVGPETPGTPIPVPEARIAPPVRRVGELPVAAVLDAPDGGRILDFGQNLVGWLRIRAEGPAGTELTLRHAEVLERGDLALRPLRNAASTDHVVLGDDPLEWEPTSTFHGFRYARVDADAAIELEVTAVVVASDLERTGWFESSHAMLDQLHENVFWGMRGNFLSIPTDCPQRDERLGWTGDIQVFAPTATFLGDADGFLRSWLRDLAHEQGDDGSVPMVIPAVLSGFAGGGSVAAWGDATTIVPWTLWQRRGDLGVLRDQYPSMRAWADYELERSGGSGLWAGEMQLGDWLDPDAPPDKPGAAKVDGDIVASGYLARSLRIVADTAALLGNSDDATRYGGQAEFARETFLASYVTANGRMMSDAPTAYALALGFDLAQDPQLRQRLADRLADLVRRRGYRIATGFVGTPLVVDALIEHGHRAAAERLLLQTENPSWLYPITQGATTVWERWDSLLEDGSVNPGEMTSFNHYALGAVADSLHRHVAGLAPAAPGYRRIRVAPRPLEALERASARHRTPYGLAEVAWRREGDEIVVTALVPANTTAEVLLDGAEPVEVGSGAHEWRAPAPRAEAPRGPYGLDSSTASVIDDPRAYRALLDAVARHDPDRADAVRRGTVWAERRTVSQSLMFAPPAMLDDVDAALRAIGEDGA